MNFLSKRPVRVFAFAFTLAMLTPVAHATGDIDAASLVAPELLSGPGWKVDPRAEIRGYQARFVIHTDWGSLHADSVELLALRVAEMPALRVVHDQTLTQALSAAGADPFLKPAAAVGHIAKQPLATLKGLPLGVSRYFGERWQRLAQRSQKLTDRGRRVITEDGSPYAATEGPLAAAGAVPERAEASWWERRGREVAGLIKREAGFPEARRRLAKQLGIDPYTGNELIAPRLDALAWAQASGAYASAKALSLVAGPAAPVLAYAVTVDRLVLQDAPEQVREHNRRALDPHCADPALLRRFLQHGAFSPTLQTELVEQYLQLAPAQGCEALLETALMADNEAQARFIVGDLRLLNHYLGADSRGGRIVPQGALLAYQSAGGEFLLPLAVDWLGWTRELRRWFDLPIISRQPNRTLVVSGGISPRAQRRLTERGWSLVPRLPYPGAPPYRH